MKTTARFAAVILALTLSVSAFAKGQFDEAQRAMMDSQWGRAEQLLKAYQEKDYNNGKGHYLLAQVYEQTRRYAEAQDQLDIAKKVAPDGRWAKAGQAEAMANRLSVKLAANNLQPRTQERSMPRVAREEPRDTYVPPVRQPERTVAHTPVATPTPAVETSKSSGGGSTFLIIVLLLASGGASIYFYLKYREQKQEENQQRDARDALTANVVDMQDRLRELRKALQYQKQESSDLGRSIGIIATNLNSTAGALRDPTEDLRNLRSNVNTIGNQLSTAENRLARKDFDPAPAPTPAPRAAAPAPRPTPAPAPRPAPAAPVYQRTAPPAPPPVVQHHHHTTVVDNSSNDLLAAVVIADAMSSSREAEARMERERERERERQRERDEERQREREEERRAERRREEREEQARRDREDEEERRSSSSRSAPAMDFGGDDDSRSSSSSSSPSMDFGGSDD